MSAHWYVMIRCDECCHEPTNWSSLTAKEARDAAKSEGWVRSGRKDLCPDCAAKQDKGDKPCS